MVVAKANTYGASMEIEFPSELLDEELFTPPAHMLSLASEQPVWRLRYADGTVGWLVFDRARARTVLNDLRFSVLPAGFAIDDGGFGAATQAIENPGDLLRLNPPQHTRVRKALTAYFTVRAVAELRPAVAQIVASRMDVMEAWGPPVDFVEEFARRVPSMTICSVLGVPHSDAHCFEEPTHVLTSGAATTFADKQAALDEFYAYVRSVIAHKRAEPGDDVISALLARGELTDEEITGVAWFLFSAGHETTAHTLSFVTFYLLYEPGRWQAMSGRPIEPVVEELFRFLPTFRTALPQRTALEDVDLDGYLVKAGEHVTVYQNVMHRDPGRYDDPDRFDPSRDASGHILFGFGRHMCLGQHLARLELRVGLEALMARFPGLRLAVPPDEVPLTRSGFMHGALQELPVTW
jgi:cytochrome P450